MATDIFILIDDIKGESQDTMHKDEIDVLSWSWGMSQTGNSHSGLGSGAGRVSVRDLTFMKYLDRASPTLAKFCCSGKHFAKATLTVRKAGGGGVEYLKIELNDGVVSGVAVTAGVGNARFAENVSLNFASFKCEYAPQLASGLAGAVIPAQWNIPKNAAT